MPPKSASEAARKRPPLLRPQALVVDADEVRARITKLTSDQEIAPDPIAVHRVDFVPSGFLSLDDALGIGGWALGRMHAFEGPADSGKTALAAAAIGAHQFRDPSSVHAFLSVEPHAGDEKFLATCGVNVDPKRFILLRPDSAEEADYACMVLMGYIEKDRKWVADPKAKSVSSITWDSWGGSPTDTMGMSSLARVGSEIWPRLTSRAQRTKTTMFVTNHLHTKPGVTFGDPRYGTGGDKFKFMQTTRLWITPKNVEKDELTKRRIAHDLRIDIVRNKVAPAFRKVELHLNYQTGFDRIVDAFTFLEERGVSLKEKADGNKYVFSFTTEEHEREEIRETGREAFVNALRGQPEAGEAFIHRATQLYAQGLDAA